MIVRLGQQGSTWLDAVIKAVKGGSKDYGSGTCNTDGSYTI